MLLSLGVKDILICDSKGIIYKGLPTNNWLKEELAMLTNKNGVKGSLYDAMIGADVFIGVSVGDVVKKEMVKNMKKDAIVFALANPIPEIFPDDAKEAGARIVATGRSDYQNQINNVLAFPGIFRGALDARASDINDEMKIAAAYAIAGVINDTELNEENIIPNVFNDKVSKKVATAVKEAAVKSGGSKNII
jgi:Malic enzyme